MAEQGRTEQDRAEQDRLVGAEVVDPAGRPLGSVTALLVDPGSLDARWLDVALLSGAHAVVPVQAASADGAGRVTIAYGEAELTSAPGLDGAVLTARTASSLLDHYGFPPAPR